MFRYLYIIFAIILMSASVLVGQGIGRYDKSGVEQKSPESGLSQTAFSLFPNPAISYFSIQGNDKVASVEVYNLAGKLMIRWDGNESNHYQINELKNGLYLVRLLDKNKKVIKVNRMNKE